uniref:FKBP prolyl isomerase like n=1 Tax=Mastacembelus armatus TaxID=205130 RepID=A0A3Q3LNR2_9TELE
MDPGRPLEVLHDSHGCHDGVDVTSWVSVCPRGLWKVQLKQIHKETRPSGCCPRMGSLCRVRVQLKANTHEMENSVSDKANEELSVQPGQSEAVDTAFQRRQDSVLQVPLGHWTTLRLGEGQCDVTEACLESMRAREKFPVTVSLCSPTECSVGKNNVSCTLPAEENLPLCATVELQAFTSGKESWEMSPGEKWEWVKSHKERGGVRFRGGDLWGAADSYSRALKLLITLYGHVREVEEKGQEQEASEQRDTNTGDKTQHLFSAREFRTIKAELHSNLSLCQLKLNQPERAKAGAAKATQLEPGGAKAWYRLGQACQMVNELEEAKQAFSKLLELQPESPAALRALKDIACREKESDVQLGLRLSKMFS